MQQHQQQQIHYFRSKYSLLHTDAVIGLNNPSHPQDEHNTRQPPYATVAVFIDHPHTIVENERCVAIVACRSCKVILSVSLV